MKKIHTRKVINYEKTMIDDVLFEVMQVQDVSIVVCVHHIIMTFRARYNFSQPLRSIALKIKSVK